MNHVCRTPQIPFVCFVKIAAKGHLERHNFLGRELAQHHPQSLHMSVGITVGPGGALDDLPEPIGWHRGCSHGSSLGLIKTHSCAPHPRKWRHSVPCTAHRPGDLSRQCHFDGAGAPSAAGLPVSGDSPPKPTVLPFTVNAWMKPPSAPSRRGAIRMAILSPTWTMSRV